MLKQIFKEIEPENIDVSWYFDGDTFKASSGSYNNTLFILADDSRRYSHNVYGLNGEEYNNLCDTINSLFNDFEGVEEFPNEYTYKQAMIDNGLNYNPTHCGKLKKLYTETYNSFDSGDFDTVSEYLTITTGKRWETLGVSSYCQGDYVTVIYCAEAYTKEQAITNGEMFLGCCKEFMCVDLDENGQEIEETSCCGFYVADNEIRHDEDYKTVLCNYEGLKPEETKVLLIDYNSMRTYTKYNYIEG